ncbi:hypothetical protein GEMRC1_006844 [Eukaryota sp. GEM-RC1]
MLRFRREIEMTNSRLWQPSLTSESLDTMADKAWFLGRIWNIGSKISQQKHEQSLDLASSIFQLCDQLVDIIQKTPPSNDKQLREDLKAVLETVTKESSLLAAAEMLVERVRNGIGVYGTIDKSYYPAHSASDSVQRLNSAQELLHKIKEPSKEKSTQVMLLLTEIQLLKKDKNVEETINKMLRESTSSSLQLVSLLSNNHLKHENGNMLQLLLSFCLDNLDQLDVSPVLLLKTLIDLATTRDQAFKYYESADDYLTEMTNDERSWFNATAWNNGVFYIRLGKMDLAEKWVKISLKFKSSDSMKQAYEEILRLMAVR